MQHIAYSKISGSWQSGGNVLIPPAGSLTIDADCTNGKRRFFAVDRANQDICYYKAFENHPVTDHDHTLAPGVAEKTFDELWKEFDRGYAMFTIKPYVNWDDLRRRYRPQTVHCTTSYELAAVFAEMLSHLRDLHVWVTVEGRNIPVFSLPRERNANPSAREAIIGRIEKAGNNSFWGKTPDHVGYIAIEAWKDSVDEQFDEILESMRNTRGLVIDVRLNGGGSEPLAQNVAGRFTDQVRTYAYSQFRNGPKHSDLTPWQGRSFGPRGPWRYDRPVLVLIGPLCMSSNESFISMMDQCPKVSTMGDRTCGSSGNPKFINATEHIRVSMPQWIDLLPDGTPLEQHGIQPNIEFKTCPVHFSENRDDLLQAALNRLAKEPLPEPIRGPALDRPHVISVYPPDGARGIDPDCEIRIRYDRPMEPHLVNLKWTKGKYRHFRYCNYDPNTFEYQFSFMLEPNTLHDIQLNEGADDGFQDIKGEVASRFGWSFAAAAYTSSEPTLINVVPEPGSLVSSISEYRLRFDRPINDFQCSIKLLDEDLSSYYGMIATAVRNGSSQNELIIPLITPAKWQGQLALSVESNHEETTPVILNHKTGDRLWDKTILRRINSAKNDETLLRLITNMLDARDTMKSLSEDVISIHLDKERQSFKSSIIHVKIKGDRHFLAIADKTMGQGQQWRIASDGEKIWCKYTDVKTHCEKLSICSYADMDVKDLTIADPFKPLPGFIGDIAERKKNDPEQLIESMNLEYLGTETIKGRECHIIRSWSGTLLPQENATSCFIRTWWINADHFLPLRVVREEQRQVTITEYNYKSINQPIPESDFQFDHLKTPAESWGFKEEGYESSFILLHDGSNGGGIAVWKGEKGSKGVSGSGLH